MNDAKTILAAAILLAASHQPLSAQQKESGAGPQLQGGAVQVADASAPAIRNITASARRPQQRIRRADAENVQPSGAQALMVLGIALIVTPAMFRGAFSN